MNNIIEYDGYIIGYKNDLIKYLESEMERLRNDPAIDIEELITYLSENNKIIEQLQEYNNFYLLGVGESVMGELTIKHVGVEME